MAKVWYSINMNLENRFQIFIEHKNLWKEKFTSITIHQLNKIKDNKTFKRRNKI